MKLNRHTAIALSLFALPLAIAVVPLPKAPARTAMATPVADDDTLYTLCGRVFPDPLAFAPSPTSAAGESPFAKGNAVCRPVTFIQHSEALSGLAYLESKFPDFVEVYDLSTDFPAVLDTDEGEGSTAGIPISTMERTKSPLTLVRVTDETVPEAGKEHFVFPLSIHGIERAGVEGGLRAIEDLATWGATSPEQPVMETDETSLPAGEVLKRSSVYFVLANPDGWRRGDYTSASPAFQRFNGNGVDLNRNFPAIGWTFRPYRPWSEPETRSFGKVLKSIKPKWTGGIDLHGQIIDRAFSFTLLGGTQRPFDKNERVLQFTRGAWADAEKRLAWSTLIKPNSAPQQCAETSTDPEPGDPEDCDQRIYGVQWGTIWDTIDYTVTGAFGDWIDSPLGLNADGIDNEMSASHLANCGTGTCYVNQAEQLHVDGNKSLIYAMLNFSLLPEDQTFRYQGRAAYLTNPVRLVEAAQAAPAAPSAALPAQDDETFGPLVKTADTDSTQEFTVEGPAGGVYNGGVKAEVTFGNAQGVSLGSTDDLSIQREVDGEWTTVETAYNQTSAPYAQAGLRADLNYPVPGTYRVVLSGPVATPFTLKIDYSTGPAWHDIGTLPVDASNIDFFAELAPFVESADKLVAVSPESIKTGATNLDEFDTLIAVDRTAIATDAALAAKAKAFVSKGGNLVLTDGATKALELMCLVPAESVESVNVYAGHVEFERDFEGALEVTYEDPLAANVDQPGTAEGPNHRHQTTEPVPLGYALMDDSGGDSNTMPQWVVDTTAFEEAGGRVVGRLDASSVTFGELPVGKGQVRILGSLLPFPTTEFDHRYGLADYALTYTGYELAKNMFSHLNPARIGSSPVPPAPPAPRPPAPAPRPGPLPATGAPAPWLPLAISLAGLGLGYRIRRLRATRG